MLIDRDYAILMPTLREAQRRELLNGRYWKEGTSLLPGYLPALEDR